jgi:hypothetical protein
MLGDMEKLPVKFGKVSGYFACYENKLTTLKGCPNYVGDNLTQHVLGNVERNIVYNKQRRIVI